MNRRQCALRFGFFEVFVGVVNLFFRGKNKWLWPMNYFVIIRPALAAVVTVGPSAFDGVDDMGSGINVPVCRMLGDTNRVMGRRDRYPCWCSVLFVDGVCLLCA